MSVAIEVEDEAWQAVPGLEDLVRRAVGAALVGAGRDPSACEVAVLLAGDETVAELNTVWRGRTGPTNVLSFPVPDSLPVPAGELRPLGDVVLAAGVVQREAADQAKALPDHVAHLIVHGVLHLLGHDHEIEADAREMERLEATILRGLGIPDPYER